MSEFLNTPPKIAEAVSGPQNNRGDEVLDQPEYLRTPEAETDQVLRVSQTKLMEALGSSSPEEKTGSIFEQIIQTADNPGTVEFAVQKLQNTRIPDKMIVVNPRPTEDESMVRFVPRDQAFNRDEVIDTPTQVTLPAARFFEDLTTAIEEELLLGSGNSKNLLDEEEKAEFLKASQQALAGHDLQIHTGDNSWKDSYRKKGWLELPDKSLAEMTPEEKVAQGYKEWQTMTGKRINFTIQPSTTIESIKLV